MQHLVTLLTLFPYRLVVEPKLKEAPAGSHEIRIEELRAATESGRALAIWEKALGPEHPNVAESLNSLAGLRGDMGDCAKAAESRYESAGEKLISEDRALIESHLVECNRCRGVIEFAAESENSGPLSLFLIPAGSKNNYYRSARISSPGENILAGGANSPTRTVYPRGASVARGYRI